MADTTTNLTRLRVDVRVDAIEFRMRARELLALAHLTELGGSPHENGARGPMLREIDLQPPASGPEVELRFECAVTEIGRPGKLVADAEQMARDGLFAAGLMSLLAIRTRPAVWS